MSNPGVIDIEINNTIRFGDRHITKCRIAGYYTGDIIRGEIGGRLGVGFRDNKYAQSFPVERIGAVDVYLYPDGDLTFFIFKSRLHRRSLAKKDGTWLRLYYHETNIATLAFLLCWKQKRNALFKCINHNVAQKIARLIYDSFHDPIWGQQKSKIKRLKQNE